VLKSCLEATTSTPRRPLCGGIPNMTDSIEPYKTFRNGSEEGEKERKKGEELLNKLLNKSTTFISSFSVRPADLPILVKFREIAKREAGSRGFSEVLLKAMKEYNQKHDLGNPQLTLLPYAKPDAPSPSRVLCAFLNGATTEGRVHCTLTGGSWIQAINCYGCRHNQLRKKRGSA